MNVDNLPQAHFKHLRWHEVKHEIAAVNPALAQTLAAAKPDDFLFKIGEYSYGAEIATAEAKVKPHAFLLLDKSCELFLEHKNNPMCYELFKKGDIAFIEQLFEQNTWQHAFWKLTTGVRNVFMLPKIGDHDGHKRLLDQYDFISMKPIHLKDHWKVFKQIANGSEARAKWQCKVLFLPPELIALCKPHITFELSKQHVAKTAQYEYANFVSFLIGVLQNEKPIKLSLPHQEQLFHLLMLAASYRPGFALLDNNEAMPLDLIQAAYSEVYRLKNYPPLIMGPDYLNSVVQSQKALYYSLNHPFSYLCSPPTNDFLTHARAFVNSIWVFNKCFDFIKTSPSIHKESQLFQVITEYEYHFYHQKFAQHKEFQDPALISQNDAGFKQCLAEDLRFPDRASFLNGCIQIKRN